MRKKNTGSIISKAMVSTLVFIMLCSTTIAGMWGLQQAHAKDIGRKNQQACDNCERIKSGTPPSLRDYASSVDEQRGGVEYGPDGYSVNELQYEKVVDGVYRGGNSLTQLQNQDPLDSDPNDYASVLPYGNTYIDANMLKWDASNSDNFIIDIPDDSPFVWIASGQYADVTDANGTPVNTDPFGNKRGVTSLTSGGEKQDLEPTIAYIGPLRGYLGDGEAYRDQSGPQVGMNVIEAQAGSYLYQITYLGAVTLKDGTKGNLVIKVPRVEFETTATNANALITVQKANEMSLSGRLGYADNNERINPVDLTVKTGAEVAEAMQGNTEWNNASFNPNGKFNDDKNIRAATGAIVDLDIQVTDAAGNPQKGSISYAATDLDFETYQDVWGRVIRPEDRYKFNEGMTIVEGSLSYAVTPYYDHANGTTRDTGWIPVAPGEAALDNPLNITRVAPGNNADGVRFSGVAIRKVRDKNGSFDMALFGGTDARNHDIVNIMGQQLSNMTMGEKDISRYNIPAWIKRQLYGKIKDAQGSVVPRNQMTNQQIFDYLGSGSFGTQRNDEETSYDTSFAVLLNAGGSSLQWSASNHHTGTASTKLFDTTLYTYVEQTHGTGGGIYFENYELADDCAVTRTEGTVTMGKGVDATATVVPEDGHRVKSITVGNADLSTKAEYTIVYDGNGKATGINDGTTTHDLNEGKVTIDGTDFEVNSDGTIDVTLNNVQDPRHVHVDFTADYYFYKVWKSDKTPTLLNLTATPFAFVFKSVDIEGTKYDIEKNGSGYTFTGGGKTYTLKNNSFTVGEGADAVTYFLEGNSLITYKYQDGSRVKDKEYHIHLEYEKKGAPMSFTVRKTDADDTAETNVQADTEDGNTVWKIRYPADGYKTKHGEDWPELSIESDPGGHDHTHVERIYWFVTEDSAPGWSLVEYDNSTAEAPGKIDAAKDRKEIYAEGDSGKLSSWASASTKDYEDAETEIEDAADNDHAYMSVFSNHDKAITKHNSWGGKIVNEVLPPVGTPKQTWGEKGAPQSTSGRDMFTVKTDTAAEGTPNEIKTVKLIDPNTGQPVDTVTVPEGTYTVGSDGTITFTPNDPNYVGDPTPVGVRGTDANGLSADTTYTPHICDTETTVTRTIVYEYANGEPVLDGEGNPKTVTQTVTFKGVLNPETGEISYPGNPTDSFDEVPSGDITGYNVDRDKVDEVTVRPRDNDLYEKVIYSPKGVAATADTTWGLPGDPQTGEPKFEMETPTLPDGSPNELTIKLIDPNTGEETESKTVDAVDGDGKKVGTYTLNDDGTVTFTPNEGYVGNPRPLELTGTDRFGTKARTTYTPHIVDPIEEDTASRTIYYTYLTEDGKEAADSITQTVKMTKHAKKVDSKTGEVLEWADWDPAEFPAVPNPKGVDEKTWTANTSAKAQKVTTPGKKDDVHIIYTKEPYTVKYLDGNHGKSDRKGNQSGEDYGNDVKGGNGVTPAKGWHFTGKYTYVIKDKNGKVIGQGETDDPTSIEITGNIEFTPVYEPNRYTIKYDANGGKGSMDDQHFTGADDSARSKNNEFTRKGYEFAGFKAKLPDGSYLKDENGNDIIFKDENDFLEYLLEYGDGAEITLEAQWVKSEYAEPGSSGGAATGDSADTALWIALMAAAAASALVMMKRRRSKR